MAGSQRIDLGETGTGSNFGAALRHRERGPDLNLVFPIPRPRGRGRHSYNQLWPRGVPKVATWCAQSDYVNSLGLLR